MQVKSGKGAWKQQHDTTVFLQEYEKVMSSDGSGKEESRCTLIASCKMKCMLANGLDSLSCHELETVKANPMCKDKYVLFFFRKFSLGWLFQFHFSASQQAVSAASKHNQATTLVILLPFKCFTHMLSVPMYSMFYLSVKPLIFSQEKSLTKLNLEFKHGENGSN